MGSAEQGLCRGQAVLGRIKQSFPVPEQATCLHVRALEIQLFSSAISEGDLKFPISPSLSSCSLLHQALTGRVLRQQHGASEAIWDGGIVLHFSFWRGAFIPDRDWDADPAACPAAVLPHEGPAGWAQREPDTAQYHTAPSLQRALKNLSCRPSGPAHFSLVPCVP